MRCQNATLWKLLNTDRATLASLPGRSNCRAANATISCTPPARARFGLKQLRPVASRCFSSTTLPSQHLLTSQHVCIPGHPPLHVFWLKPSRRGPQQTCTRLFFFLCVVSTLSRRGLLTSRAAIVAPRTPEGDKLTSRAAVVAPRTPEGD